MPLKATAYVTTLAAVRKTADDCRRLCLLLDSLKVDYDTIKVETKEMRHVLTELCGTRPLPLCFVGQVCIGTYDEVAELNELGNLPSALRAAGYTEKVAGGEHIVPAAVETPKSAKVVVKKVIKKALKPPSDHHPEVPPILVEEEQQPPDESDAPPPPPPDDSDAPPPPPPDESDAPPPPPDDG